MSIRTLILDDRESSRRAACAALAEYKDVEIVGQFSSGEELFAFLREESAQLLFLDIELNAESGFAVAKQLRETHPQLLIVFFTGHSSYAIDGYDFQPVNFLTKPINKEKLGRTIEEVRRRLGSPKEPEDDQLMFQLLWGYRIVNVQDICYIERLGRKVYLHTISETLRIGNYTMKDLVEMLADYDMFQCHQSFIVSLRRVEVLQGDSRQGRTAVLRGCSEPVPVARGKYSEMVESLQRLKVHYITR